MAALRISDLIDSRAILFRPRSTDKVALMREMVAHLAGEGRLRSAEEALSDLLAREREKGTGLGHGVAVPHCRSKGADRMASAFALSPQGLDFGAADRLPSKFIFLLISPEEATTAHVQALALMARVLKQPGVQEALLAAKNTTEVEKAFAEAKP
jgi:PTS system fructose-specific IIC component